MMTATPRLKQVSDTKSSYPASHPFFCNTSFPSLFQGSNIPANADYKSTYTNLELFRHTTLSTRFKFQFQVPSKDPDLHLVKCWGPSCPGPSLPEPQPIPLGPRPQSRLPILLIQVPLACPARFHTLCPFPRKMTFYFTVSLVSVQKRMKNIFKMWLFIYLSSNNCYSYKIK